MGYSTTEFKVPEGIRSDQVTDLLMGLYRPILVPTETLNRVFYDTFDWAVFHDGGILECRMQRTTRRLIRSALDSGSPEFSQTLAGDVGLVSDLSPGPVRDWLMTLCPVRRLLPLVDIECHVSAVRLVNDDGETLLRLEIEERIARPPGGAPFALPSAPPCAPLGTRMHLIAEPHREPIRREIIEILVEKLALEPAETPLVLEALEACGRCPGDYSSKIESSVEPEQRADDALKQVLSGLLTTLVANIDGACAHLDPEFLHDLRVATRRTRSALGQVKGVFPSALVDDYQARFAWLQQITGPARDLDVYLLDFERYRDALPMRLRPGMEPFRGFLVARQAEEQERLAAQLRSPAFTDLIGDWQEFLSTPVPEHPAEPNAARSIKSIADERIRRLEQRVRREGLAIRPDSPATELHALRKRCKKLRYLMELFQSLYPRAKLARLIKLLKILLDQLGLIQDLAVQADHVLDWAAQMHAEGHVGTETLLAMGALVGQLLERQEEARAAFAEVFGQYLHDDHQELFRTLFRRI